MGLLDEHVAERPIRILAAVRWSRAGLQRLTMRELAKVARVSVPTLYNQFGSKDAILAAELAQWVGRAASGARRAVDGTRSAARGQRRAVSGSGVTDDGAR